LQTATLRGGWYERADGIVNVERMLATVLEAVETKHAQWAEAQLPEEIAARVTGPDPAAIAEVIETVRAPARSRGSTRSST
jgi:hypothetical protein